MRLLVVGGAGFLGSHLSEKLLDEGHEVTCVDNFYTGVKSNIEHLQVNPKFQIITHDIISPLHVEVDGIFNLACPASPIHYQRDPIRTIKTSILGSINLLELARDMKIPILQASTSEVYGDPQVSPQPETYWGNVNPIGIRACYDEGKRAAETLFSDFHRQYSVDIRVARIFNTYGPRMLPNDGRVVSNFIVQALSNQDLTIYGDGTQTRSFCYVSDLIGGLISLFFSGVSGTPINLGNPEPLSMLELAREIIELTKSKSKISFEPLPADDPTQRKPNIELAKNLLNWTPEVSRSEGLRRTIDYFEDIN